MFYNRVYERVFITQCTYPEGYTLDGTEEKFVVPEAQFCSEISQDDADQKAADWAEDYGQDWANKIGGCPKVFANDPMEEYFFSSICEEGKAQEEPILFKVRAGQFLSCDSKIQANECAKRYLMHEGQKIANMDGVCKTVYYSQPQHGWFSKTCKPGWKGPEKYRSIEAGAAISFISVEDANDKAKAILKEQAQEWVEYNTECEPIIDPCSKI